MKYLQINSEVEKALAVNKPVVALESTIISHGFNYPENLECALNCEKIIKEAGAQPATIAILDGVVKIGLSREEIELFATSKGILKCSRRDAASIISQKLSGATTVAGTMMFAAMAGIKVFATGGIGGVHRNAEVTFDISADLEELAGTNVAVVCAGAKSILDIPLTKEYLETKGVPVIGYNTDYFPNFYTRSSGLEVDYNLKTPEDIANVIQTSFSLGLKGGILICNPIPEENALDENFIKEKIEATLYNAIRSGITGKDTTPFLLANLHEITGGRSIAANKALVYNNAKAAAHIAAALCHSDI